jgi:hypothetical protein
MVPYISRRNRYCVLVLLEYGSIDRTNINPYYNAIHLRSVESVGCASYRRPPSRPIEAFLRVEGTTPPRRKRTSERHRRRLGSQYCRHISCSEMFMHSLGRKLTWATSMASTTIYPVIPFDCKRETEKR